MTTTTVATTLDVDAFTRRLRDVGEAAYHDKHPFHQLLHGGMLSRRQLQAWVRNRYYYQAMIPRKDAAILHKATDPQFRRAWMRRVLDQDGAAPDMGGLYKWLRLAEAVGLDPDAVAAFDGVLPAVRFAVDAYLHFVMEHSLLEAVASSLTELFAGGLHARRLPVFAQHYPWVSTAGLSYFETRVTQVPVDVEFGLAYVCTHATDQALQQSCLHALRYKCDILWSLLDAVHFAYVAPGLLPPGWRDTDDA